MKKSKLASTCISFLWFPRPGALAILGLHLRCFAYANIFILAAFFYCSARLNYQKSSVNPTHQNLMSGLIQAALYSTSYMSANLHSN